ncbi:hypothetical protein [Pseudoneobacillus sp. C159]
MKILGLMFGGLALVLMVLVLFFIVISLVKVNRPKLFHCPHCMELIPQELVVCRFCGKNVNTFYGSENYDQPSNHSIAVKLRTYINNLNMENIKLMTFVMLLASLILYYISTLLTY